MSDTPTYILDEQVTDIAAVNGVVTITVKATKGNFKVSVEGDTTANVKYNASAAELQTALEALGAVDSGDIVVTGGPGDAEGKTPYKLTFNGQYAGANDPVITTDVSGLEEGTKTAAVAVVTDGLDAPADAVQVGTGLADRTGESSPLAGASPAEDRAENAEDYGD